jgi:hypothetical protein
MTKKNTLKKEVLCLIILFLTSSIVTVATSRENCIIDTTSPHTYLMKSDDDVKQVTLDFEFSTPEIKESDTGVVVTLKEGDFSTTASGHPVLPVNLTLLTLPFGSEIITVDYTTSPPWTYNLTHPLTYGILPGIDNIQPILLTNIRAEEVCRYPEFYPSDWISYHTGGGLSFGDHVTFFALRVYPIRYEPSANQLTFVQHIAVEISYRTPSEPLLQDYDVYDLLILTPQKYTRYLQPLVEHKNNYGIKTNLVELPEVYDRMFWYGRDYQEHIKYFIKHAVEYWGVTYVLLVGGLQGQTSTWDLPVRYSHTVPLTEQEYPEESFISDLYYADVYDDSGQFSSWDPNEDDVFADWRDSQLDEMDLYPDVYLGRLPCRTTAEVRIMVDKIITYETGACDASWFNKLLLVAGDSYNDEDQFNEGELISEEAITKMPGFEPVRVYASQQDINRKTVNNALNAGCGFAYFCGHGSIMTWNTHFPPEGTEWCTGYEVKDMIFLRNRDKLPITIVGGCHNGQFDSTMMNILFGVLEDGLHYFSWEKGNAGRFWYWDWAPNCWGWWLTSKTGGGAIATIANTGLGTHGDGDIDQNGIADYLEVLDGWMELRFLELYGKEHKDMLGENHGETMTGYLHRFLGDGAVMDVKMVQQWELFGDPSLKIGGYP